MSKRFLVNVPNPQFSENVMGIQFNKGKAIVDEHSIDLSLGYSVDEIARQMKVDLGYEVEELSASAPDINYEIPEEPAAKHPKRK